MNTASLSRRDFLRQSALLAASAPLLSASVESNTPPARPPIVGFSKPFQSLRPDDMAELVAEVGWDGIECPVRRRGQIEPERVADELPHVVEALRRHGAAVHILATNITSMDNPFAERVLRTAATLGVRIIRLGYWYYGDDDSPTHHVQEIRPALRDLEAACRSLGLRAGYQNHSGHNYVGGPLWDILPLIQEINSPHLGLCFDIGHATIEGGLSWPIDARAAASSIVALYVKDFAWSKTSRGWQPAWCPLGDGMISSAYFQSPAARTLDGPISQHHEYELGDRHAMVAHMKRDLNVLRQWLG